MQPVADSNQGLMSNRPVADTSRAVHTAIVAEPINVASLLQRVSDDGVGAVTLFLGTVRNINDGRTVTGIDYEAYGPMAEHELAAIASEAVQAAPGLRLAVEHRTGTLVLGDVSVAIAAAHAHRAEALNASRVVIEAIKKRLPVWKREHYNDGDWQWVDPTKAPTRQSESALMPVPS